jgi:hypothetical protein
MQQLELEKIKKDILKSNKKNKHYYLPNNFISSNGPGGGNGKPLLVENKIGTRPVPSVLIGNKPGGGGGGKSDDEGRFKFGGCKRPNGDGKFIVEFVIDDGGKGNGHTELVVVVIEGVVLAVVTVVVEVLSVVDVEICVDNDDGLVLFVEETVLFVVDSSLLSVFSVESVSLNRLGLI